jgi:uncharacterized protein YdiU (UPF0061 family)
MTIFYRQLAELESNIENLEQISNEDLMKPLMHAYYLSESLTEEYKNSIGDWLRAYIGRLQNDARPDSERRAAMNLVNPKYVLRNYLAQLAIDKSEQGDHSIVNELLEVLRRPYDEQPEQEAEYFQRRPDWARQRAGCSMLSCSS